LGTYTHPASASFVIFKESTEKTRTDPWAGPHAAYALASDDPNNEGDTMVDLRIVREVGGARYALRRAIHPTF